MTTESGHRESVHEYEVALSFAGEDRKFAQQLAECLTKKNVHVFYDRYEKADLWGKDLYEHLAEIYKDRALYCVIFISEHYASKLWTKHERKSAQARAFTEDREYILPLRLDDTQIPGIPSTIGHVDLRKTSMEEVCKLVLQKLSTFYASKSREVSKVTCSVRPVDHESRSSGSANMRNGCVGTLLAGSIKDLVFTINTQGTTLWDKIAIYIPPGFTIPWAEPMMPTERPLIQVLKALQSDRYGPGWGVVYVSADAITYGDAGISPDSFQNPVIVITADKGSYYIRINRVTAPCVAGRYFFKVALFNSEASYSIRGEDTTDSIGPSRFVPPENWPVMLVKGEIDPAIITGNIKYGGYNASLYGLPVEEAGQVWAHMTTKLDPYTGNKLIDCSSGTLMAPTAGCTDAVGYFNATAHGHFEVEGVAPGVYDIYAEAAGYPQLVIASGVTVLKGQSLHFDGYLNPGPVIHGKVSTKHEVVDNPWPENAYIKIELYQEPTQDRIPDRRARTEFYGHLHA